MNKTSPRTPEQEIRRLKDVNKKLRKDLATVERMYGDLSSWKVDAHCVARDLIKTACEHLSNALVELNKKTKRPE